MKTSIILYQVPPEQAYGYPCTKVRLTTWKDQCYGTHRKRNYIAYYEAVVRDERYWRDPVRDPIFQQFNNLFTKLDFKVTQIQNFKIWCVEINNFKNLPVQNPSNQNQLIRH